MEVYNFQRTLASAKRKLAKSQDHLPQDEIRAKEALNIRKDSTSRGRFNSHNGGTSNEQFEEAHTSTEPDGKIFPSGSVELSAFSTASDGKLFRGKVGEARCSQTKYKMFMQTNKGIVSRRQRLSSRRLSSLVVLPSFS